MDPIQEALLKEQCVLVNEDDEVVGAASKRHCHLVQENGDIKLHRAFSVFLFNSKGELLVQKRASTKVTFPNKYTNTCCSHPLASNVDELVERNAEGVKKAAIRRLHYELGIPLKDLTMDEMKFLGKIHYKDVGDGVFGEHEIDYVIFIQKDVQTDINKNEVSEMIYLKREDLESFVQENRSNLTPWFALICHHLLVEWWASLGTLKEANDKDPMLRLTS